MTVSQDSKTDINAVFTRACFDESLEDMDACLQKGADINHAGFNHASTALIYSARNNKTEVLEYLLKHNPDLDAKDLSGNTALNEAALNGHAICVQYLLEAGADLSLRNNTGKTALNRATGRGNLAVVKLINEEFQKRYAHNGFTRENDHTVSTVENLEASEIKLKKVFNFASREITTLTRDGIDIQQFCDIAHQKRIEDAAEALEKTGGKPGDWKHHKPAIHTKPRVK